MLGGHGAFYTIADDLIRTVATDVGAVSTTEFTRVGVVDGAMSWDDCTCGMLIASVVRMFVSERFPEPAGPELICDAPYLVAELALQAVRCAPVQNEQGVPPSVEMLDTSARIVIMDGAALLDATLRFMCGLKDAGDISDYLTTQLVYVGPQGGCVGSELHVQVGLLRGVM